MKVPNTSKAYSFPWLSLSRLQNEGSQLAAEQKVTVRKSIKATE